MEHRLPVPSFAGELEHDWRRLVRSPESLRRANQWSLRALPFTSLDELLGAVGYRPDSGHRIASLPASGATTDAVDPSAANELLGLLVSHAATDQLAGRVVLQRILPGLRSAAGSWRHGCRPAGVQPGAVFDELVAVAWETIATYDVARRPYNIAANLIRTTIDRAFVQPTRRMRATEQPADPTVLATHPVDLHTSPSSELIDLLAVAVRHRQIDRRAITLVRDLLNADGSTAAVARRYGVTARTIRNRRTHAIAQLRHVTASAV